MLCEIIFAWRRVVLCFWPETIAEIFLYLMVLICKEFINYFSKFHFVALHVAVDLYYCPFLYFFWNKLGVTYALSIKKVAFQKSQKILFDWLVEWIWSRARPANGALSMVWHSFLRAFRRNAFMIFTLHRGDDTSVLVAWRPMKLNAD